MEGTMVGQGLVSILSVRVSFKFHEHRRHEVISFEKLLLPLLSDLRIELFDLGP